MASNEGGAPRQMTSNEAMTKGQKLTAVLSDLEFRKDELSAVLPPDITFQIFHATINQALRANPDLLECTGQSIVNACVKAAYDGLRVDGKEAAIVWDMVTIRTRGAPDRKEKQARYMPMYQGLVQQVLRGGMVIACEADVIYENDEYEILRGTNAGIYHKPFLKGPRGNAIAVYNIATLPSGYKASMFMTGDEVRDVQKESKSGWDATNNCSKGVWKRWEGEQWKKTVLRRHRKTLPVGRDVVIRDMEAQDEFQQFDKSRPHPQMTGPAPARPTREALRHQPDNGTAMDFGGFNQDTGEVIEHERDEQPAKQQQRSAERQDDRAQQSDPARAEPAIPADSMEWAVWSTDIERLIAQTKSHDDLGDLHGRNIDILNQADKALHDRVSKAFTDRAADIAAGPDDGAAADDSGNDTAAGDR